MDKSVDKRNEPQSGVIRDLLDIQFELDSLQQGIHHMNKITPDNPPPSADDLFETDPFGDSFANMKVRGELTCSIMYIYVFQSFQNLLLTAGRYCTTNFTAATVIVQKRPPRATANSSRAPVVDHVESGDHFD